MSEQHTTAERIERQLNDIHDTYLGSVYDCFRVIAKELAAEIDALTAQRDEATAKAKALDADNRELLEGAKAALANLDYERAEVERLRPAAEAWRRCHGYAYVTEAEARAREAAQGAA